MIYVERMPANLLKIIFTFGVLWITHAIFTVNRYVVFVELDPRYKPAIVLLEQVLIFNARAVFV